MSIDTISDFIARIDARRGALYVGVGNTYSGPAQPTTDAMVQADGTIRHSGPGAAAAR